MDAIDHYQLYGEYIPQPAKVTVRSIVLLFLKMMEPHRAKAPKMTLKSAIKKWVDARKAGGFVVDPTVGVNREDTREIRADGITDDFRELLQLAWEGKRFQTDDWDGPSEVEVSTGYGRDEEYLHD